MSKCLVNVADRMQLSADWARIDAGLITGKASRRCIAGPDSLERGLRGEHARSHREMNALEAHRVQEAAGVARDQGAIHERPWNRVPAAFRQGFCAVAYEGTAVEQLRDRRVLLEAVEGHVRIEARIVVIESHDETDR